ncbi:LacI family DNA-binding transcriptional regulator [Phytoactinopolyspora halotolerans]|uniref:LacI family transcriptional regulator n=1 Tax=Phytoactinopolyspora halotolerans TaxID=1981512 RepID=A0A6L9SDD7_9ACTN|nr:LacI family DNA-binding transcriptional regulator [Phytoactinopolyspora halotolerans]NEE03385.1 LacI family transcriptional regulator [Phytoactinopolyspora halotolerans]
MPTRARAVSRADVAKLAGVSPSAVSLVLNGRGDELRLSKEIQERIRDAAATLRYVPNSAARAMVGQRHLTVGVVTTHPPSKLRLPIFEDVMVGAVEGATRRQHTVKFLPPVLESQSYDVFGVLRDAQVDGVVVHNLDWLARELADWRTPVVHIGLGVQAGDLPLDQVGSISTDECGGLREAARHLIDGGRTEVVMVAGATGGGEPLPRLRAFADEFTSRGLSPPRHIDPGPWTWSSQHGYRATMEALDRWPDATAVHAGNDWMAVGAMHAIHESGRRIPDDIALVGFGDFPMCAYLTPPLTSVRWPLHEVGVRAVTMLVGQMNGERDGVGSVELPTELVVRQSSAGVPD